MPIRFQQRFCCFSKNEMMYHANLNQNHFNRYKFCEMKMLDLNGPIDSIQIDLFKLFKKQHYLKLRSQNVKNHFVNNNKQLDSLNSASDTNVNEKLNEYFVIIVYQAFSNVKFYNYPDEDFCYFKSFPHQWSVVHTLQPTSKLKCKLAQSYFLLFQYAIRDPFQIRYHLQNSEYSYNYIQYYIGDIFRSNTNQCYNESL